MPVPVVASSRELPHGFVIFIAVFFGSHTGKVLERLDKVALRRKGKVIGNVYDGLVRVAQEMRRLFYFSRGYSH